jgi:hypothetical protein
MAVAKAATAAALESLRGEASDSLGRAANGLAAGERVCETGAKAVAHATMAARTRSWQFFIFELVYIYRF